MIDLFLNAPRYTSYKKFIRTANKSYPVVLLNERELIPQQAQHKFLNHRLEV
jgi:hypothetical protein